MQEVFYKFLIFWKNPIDHKRKRAGKGKKILPIFSKSCLSAVWKSEYGV
jgi:hypothetical protein